MPDAGAGMSRQARAARPLYTRELLASAGLLLLLVVGLAWLAAAPREQVQPPYSLSSTQSDGLLALRLWLTQMGYRVADTGADRFALPADGSLLFVYPNRRAYTEAESEQIRRWVEDGHTLALIIGTPADRVLKQTFEVDAGESLASFSSEYQRQPLLPALGGEISGSGSARALRPSSQAAVPVLTSASGETLAGVRAVGKGWAWYLSERHALTNAGLAGGQDGGIVPALLRAVPAGGRVVFDTYHMFGAPAGAPDSEIETLQEWLYRTAVGRALLFGALALIAFVLLQGARLGPAVASGVEARRREAAEYVVALAALQRRARQRGAVARHHKARLKAGLARAAGLSPDLPDEAFLAGWRAAAGDVDAGRAKTVSALFAGLDGAPDEAALVRLVAQVDEVLRGAAG